MRTATKLQTALLLLCIAVAATPVSAHPAPYSYLDLRLGPRALEATLTAHTLDLAHELKVVSAEALLEPATATAQQVALLNLLRGRLALLVDGRALTPELLRVEPLPERQALALSLRWATATAPGRLKIHCALFPYDPQHQTLLNVYEAEALVRQEVFNQQRTTFEYFSDTRAGTLAAFKTCFSNGVLHFIAGLDHCVFLLGLFLLGGSSRRLLLFGAALAAAQTVTLTLAALNVVNPAARVIEVGIALSIVYIGLDNLLVGTSSRDVRVWLAALFGLLHGFSVAGSLRASALPQGAAGLGRVAFSFGLVIGLFCLVMLLATLLATLRERHPAWQRHIVSLASVGVSAAGAYWFIQRVFFSR